MYFRHMLILHLEYIFGNEIEEIEEINPKNGNIISEKENLKIFSASIFVASKDRTHSN